MQVCDIMSRKPLIPITCLPEKCRRHFTGALLLLLSFLLFADQQLVAPNLHAIGADFNLTDDGEGWDNMDLVLGGYLPLFFFALGTPLSLFIGPIIDRTHRRNLFVLLVFLAEIPCFITFFATEVWQLLFFRALTGISMAGAEPLIYSIMSDMYSKRERTLMVRSFSLLACFYLLAFTCLLLLAGYLLAGLLTDVAVPSHPIHTSPTINQQPATGIGIVATAVHRRRIAGALQTHACMHLANGIFANATVNQSIHPSIHPSTQMS